MEIWLAVASALWLIAPAFASNCFPPLMRGHMPIDMGRKWKGKPILGRGKTIEGLIGGIVFGIVFGLLLIYLQPAVFSLASQSLTAETATTLSEFNMVFPHLTFVMVALLSMGAMLGDILGSFIKRRIGLKRGQSAPGMDQLGFIIVAMILVSPFYSFTPEVIITILLITPVFHLSGNAIGYLLRLKKEPY